ncbi:MAG: hypothetical protein ACWA41_08640 [Putridiphycobacter sp.]
MVNWHWYLYGFGLGTFKYMPSHWFLQWSTMVLPNNQLSFLELFLPPFLGAVAGMAVFYFLSDYLMERSVRKKAEKIKKLEAQGIDFKPKKIFTRTNKLMVKIKRTFNIYVFTFIAPLFLSIPIGSIVCAKFYGHQKKTFPLMMLNMAIYGIIDTILVLLIYE